jgi:hypothetical protein
METKSRLIFAWISGTIIVILSLAVAFICFNILQSSAEATLQNWKLGGGIAAFLVTASFLSTTFITFYRLLTSEQIDEYRKRIQELETKLIKGAPCPLGYTIDIDEKHKLVFARPNEWEPKGGVLYAYLERRKQDDLFTANFNVIYADQKDVTAMYNWFDGTIESVQKLYESEMERIEQEIPQGVMSKEFVTIDSIKSIKYVNTYDLPLQKQSESEEQKYLTIRQSGAMIYVARARGLYLFTFSDDRKDFLRSSEVFNNVILSIRFL